MADLVDYDLDEMEARPFTLMPTWRGDKFIEIVAYPVIVETWDHKNHGRGKRGWLAQFNEAERKTISTYYAKFYRWHLVTGTPQKVMCSLKTVNLLRRAVAFFSTI